MGSQYETRIVRYSNKTRELEDAHDNVTKLGELYKTNEEIKQAKDDAMQSWLDSRPLIDELERLKTDLASAKNQAVISNNVISELESQLETTNMSIRSKKEEELNNKTMIDKTVQESDKTREEMEQNKLETDEERRARSKLKQVLRLRRQTLRTLQLTLRAIRLESEAFGASSAEAVNYINRSKMENTKIQLPQDDYYELTRRAKEETSLADWRVSVSAEQRVVAEDSRHLALRRFKEIHSENRSRKKKTTGNGNIAREAEEDSRIMVGAQVNSRQIASPKARDKLIREASQRNPQQQLKRSKSSNKKLVKKKKPTIFVQIRTFLVRKITRLFG